MGKDTSRILEELKNCENFKSFYQENKMNIPNQQLSDYLQELILKKKMKKADVIRKSELSETYAYQIFSGIRMPDRKKLLCLAVGMALNLEETQTLLKCSGYAQLYPKKPWDCILTYGICKAMTVVEINELLYDYEMETLG